MERLNKRQKEILTRLSKVFPEPINEDVLLTKLKGKPKDIDILADIKLLEEKNFVTVGYGAGSYFPVHLTITPKGIEKLRESYITRFKESAHNNPWAVVAIIISLILGIVTVYYYSENIRLQNENLRLQNKIIQDNELKQNIPPTIWLTQEFRNGSAGELEIMPTLHFKKNSDRLFTISNYEINVTLNGKHEVIAGAGYPARLRDEGINEEKVAFGSFYPEIRYNEFNHGINDLVIDYILEIKDMDSQIRYWGNVTTDINSSSNLLKFPSGYKPVLFNWTKI